MFSWTLIQWNSSQSIKKFGRNLQNETPALGSGGLSAAGLGRERGQYSSPAQSQRSPKQLDQGPSPVTLEGEDSRPFQTLKSSPLSLPLLPGGWWRNSQYEMEKLMNLWNLLTPWRYIRVTGNILKGRQSQEASPLLALLFLWPHSRPEPWYLHGCSEIICSFLHGCRWLRVP